MPGLVPGIHVFLPRCVKDVDGRDKPAMTKWKDQRRQSSREKGAAFSNARARYGSQAGCDHRLAGAELRRTLVEKFRSPVIPFCLQDELRLRLAIDMDRDPVGAGPI